jgi:hypothetical protein
MPGGLSALTGNLFSRRNIRATNLDAKVSDLLLMLSGETIPVPLLLGLSLE